MLKLPGGAFEIAGLPALKMAKNPFGSVRVDEGPGLIHYDVRFSRDISWDRPPDGRDLIVPDEVKPGLSGTVHRLGLDSKSPGRIIDTLTAFFQDNSQDFCGSHSGT